MNDKSSISLLSNIHSITQDFLMNKLTENGFIDFASSHGNILFQLNINEKMTMKKLSEKINRDKSTTTVLVRKLESEGYIKGIPDPDDKRSRIVYLTEKGKKYNSITSDISTELNQTFYKGFSDKEKEEFISYLQRIKKNFEK